MPRFYPHRIDPRPGGRGDHEYGGHPELQSGPWIPGGPHGPVHLHRHACPGTGHLRGARRSRSPPGGPAERGGEHPEPERRHSQVPGLRRLLRCHHRNAQWSGGSLHGAPRLRRPPVRECERPDRDHLYPGESGPERGPPAPGPTGGGMMDTRIPIPHGDTPPRAPRSRRGGFSLIEVIVALMVLSIGILGMAAGAGWMVRVAHYGELETRRSAALQSAVETVRAQLFDQVSDDSEAFGDITVSWTPGPAGTNSRSVEFVVVGPGRVSSPGGGMPPVGTAVTDTFTYTLLRRD
ncbi:MAG: prepilin-type N-terminal cleavage/methylation domain-containing protein [Gemmatimonadales bacterium]|nr:MAG: prepilin-type N-terminal cleavage/methylation domain-containing protein [Gemmatimonadales bacterium]